MKRRDTGKSWSIQTPKYIKIPRVVDMLEETHEEASHPRGFSEYDWVLLEVLESPEFLKGLSHDSLEMIIDAIERNSFAGIHRKFPLTNEEIKRRLEEA